MKFGGTSVGDATAIRRLVAVVGQALDSAPLVVVSAMARVTNALLALDGALAAGDTAAATTLLRALRDRHAAVANELRLSDAVQAAVRESFHQLEDIVRDAPHGSDARRRDLVAGFGELWSSWLVVGACETGGLLVDWFDARSVIRTDEHFGSAIPEEAVIRAASAAAITPKLGSGRVVVTQGFIGATAAGVPTTLGRGGSDFSAALLGAALDAERVEIWTDVDGLMSADPRVVPGARLLTHATYDEAAELAAFGAKVLHPATQLPLVEAGIPIVIRNTFAPEKPGTWIGAESLD
ncbi:MAG: aspartate kinase, partial [Gemmatimonadota bacterium]